MPEWLIERGIGEVRSVRLVDGEIVEARIDLDGIVPAGTRLNAQLVRTGRNGVARDRNGVEYLLPNGAPGVTEGGRVDIVVTRSAIPGAEPWKRPLAKVASADEMSAAVDYDEGSLPADWDDLIEEARSGIVRFEGGELRVSATPAMTLIDVDGSLPARALAMSGAKAAARAILRLDIGGSIGVDLPTVAGKADRQAIGETVDATLPKPFERTAVNGFGFLQIVRPRCRASLIELAQDRGPFEARALLRRVSNGSPGAKRLAAHPAVIATFEARLQWLDALARQVGGAISLRADAALPISGGYAEPV